MSYEPYRVDTVGGIGSFVVLQSPNGTQYKLDVNDSGELVAKPINTPDAGSGDIDDSGELWNLSNKTLYNDGKSYYVTETEARSLEGSAYVLGTTVSGIWNSTAVTEYSIDGENITLNSRAYHGISVPVTLKSGAEYTLRFTTDMKCTVSLASYTSNGVFRTHIYLARDVLAGTYTVKFVPSEAAYYMLVFAPMEAGTVSFTDISLTRDN